MTLERLNFIEQEVKANKGYYGHVILKDEIFDLINMARESIKAKEVGNSVEESFKKYAGHQVLFK